MPFPQCSPGTSRVRADAARAKVPLGEAGTASSPSLPISVDMNCLFEAVYLNLLAIDRWGGGGLCF